MMQCFKEQNFNWPFSPEHDNCLSCYVEELANKTSYFFNFYNYCIVTFSEQVLVEDILFGGGRT